MTALEKNVYNTFLRISRSRQNKPFKLRKDFSKFQDTENYVYVKKIAMLLANHKHINIEDFFNAPYEVYPDDASRVDLKFYTSLKATSVYSIYKKKQDDMLPDEQIERVKDTLYFIYSFCKGNNLDLDSYIKHKTGTEHSFMLHLRERKVNIYALFGMKHFDTVMNRMNPDAAKFTIGYLYSSLDLYRSRYYNSKNTINVVNQGTKKLRTILNN